MTITVGLGARLRAARKAAGFKTSKLFLKKYKIPASTHSQYESGARTPDSKTLQFYSRALEVNYSWLKTGKGQPFAKEIIDGKKKLNEELLSYRLIQNSSYTINNKYLTTIFYNLLIHNGVKITKSSISKILNDAIEIYSNAIQESSKNKSTLALIKDALNIYKKSK